MSQNDGGDCLRLESEGKDWMTVDGVAKVDAVMPIDRPFGIRIVSFFIISFNTTTSLSVSIGCSPAYACAALVGAHALTAQSPFHHGHKIWTDIHSHQRNRSLPRP